MTVQDIITFLEELAPLQLQEGYDNSGFIIGNRDNRVSRILVCLDADKRAIDTAIQSKCELVLSHHPVIFRPVKCFTGDTKEGVLLATSILNNIAFISAHTNFDSAVGGLTDLLCERLGLLSSRVLMRLSPTSLEGHGLGRFGELEEPVSGADFIKTVKMNADSEIIRYVGDIPSNVLKIAVYNGSYDREILNSLCRVKPDVLVTGDLKYHDAQELLNNGIFTIDAGHFGTERHFVDDMAKLLNKRFPDLELIRYQGSDVFRFC